MEIPPGALNLQRALAVLLLSAAVLTGWVEHGSPLSAKLRAGKPYLVWVAAREAGVEAPRLHLTVYDPLARTLGVLHVPEDARLEGKRTLGRAYQEALRASDDRSAATRAAEDLASARLAALSPEPADWSGAARMDLDVGDPDEESEPPLRAALALKSRLRSPRAWWALLRAAASGLASGDRSAADPLLLAFELRRVPLESLHPVWLPGEAEAPAVLTRLLSREPAAPSPTTVTVEVLNGAGVDGLASSASKMLRLKGVDVVETGSAPRPRRRTLVYDRVGDFSRAAAVIRMLDCPGARAVTRLDASRAVDASVELGADCAGLGADAGPDSQ